MKVSIKTEAEIRAIIGSLKAGDAIIVFEKWEYEDESVARWANFGEFEGIIDAPVCHFCKDTTESLEIAISWWADGTPEDFDHFAITAIADIIKLNIPE